MMVYKNKMISMIVLLVFTELVTVSVSRHCSSSLSSPELASMLSRSHILVKASVDKVMTDHSATIRIEDIFKGKGCIDFNLADEFI